jgi:anthranilate synthase/aminodeoxychorismate synthase-like glutamine amidotransferase
VFLIIDNYDSFVFNLADYVHQAGEETHVMMNDTVTYADIKCLKPKGIFISPGPKHPKDIVNVINIIQKFAPTIPIFGICLGHQAIGYAFGATVAQVKPAHGYTSHIIHNDTVIFKDIPQNTPVGRYHSLAIMNNSHFPECLEITAYTDDAMIMAVKHKTYPTFGVQFHPESILTSDGLVMIKNFIKSID